VLSNNTPEVIAIDSSGNVYVADEVIIVFKYLLHLLLNNVEEYTVVLIIGIIPPLPPPQQILCSQPTKIGGDLIHN
jgi:hypothetical protein